MGACCSRNGPGFEGLARKEDTDDEEEELSNAERLKFHSIFDNEEEKERCPTSDAGARIMLKGSSEFASMHSQQGWKGTNQDAMTVWEEFGGMRDQVFCGVFDGHGQFGHRVSCYSRDMLPSKLSSALESLPQLEGECFSDYKVDDVENEAFSSWEKAIFKAFEELDKDLKNHSTIDCICSGTTAVSVVKQREHLIVANLGDSRAVLATRDDKNQLMAVQLTVDLKPNLPSEAERIRSCRGRIYALGEEPEIHRIWMPDEDYPGLAMARALGDFCLKDFGLISTPQVTCRKITDKDEFVVLATDGVWDVLTNKEVIKIVSSTTKRSDAAKNVVERAVRAWRSNHSSSKVDDCAVVCLFFKLPVLSAKPSFNGLWRPERSRETSFSDSYMTTQSGEIPDIDETRLGTKDEWTALEGLSRMNSVIRVRRMARAMSWRRKSVQFLEEVK